MIRKINEGEKERDRIYDLFDADKNFLRSLIHTSKEYHFLTGLKNGELKPITIPCETYAKLVHWAIKGLETDQLQLLDVPLKGGE